MDSDFLSAVALSGRVTGALFWYAPDSPQAAPLIATLATPEWHHHWPLAHPQLEPLALRLAASHDDELATAWQRCFIGPGALPAPPWGSVWLDRECVVFGDSLVELRQWMTGNHIQPVLPGTEPEDHIGALLLLAAWLAETRQHQLLEQLLAWHLLPWSEAFLCCLIRRAAHPFYATLAELTRLTLAAWRENMLMPVAQKTIWFTDTHR